MFVTKRDGHREPVAFDKILQRLQMMCTDFSNVNVTRADAIHSSTWTLCVDQKNLFEHALKCRKDNNSDTLKSYCEFGFRMINIQFDYNKTL